LVGGPTAASLLSVALNWLGGGRLLGGLILLLLGHILLLLALVALLGLGSGRGARSSLLLLLISLLVTLALGSLALLVLSSLGLLVALEGLEHLLLVDHLVVETIVASKANWHGLKVLVWVEASRERSQVLQVRNLNHRGLLRVEWSWAHVVHWHGLSIEVKLTLASVVIVSALVSVVVLHFLGHWRESHTFWKVGEWVNELSPLLLIVVERALITELAFNTRLLVFAWLGLVVRVNCSERCLPKVLGERIIWLSQFGWTVSKLTELLERAFTVIQEMLAHLGLVLLLESVELALVAVETIVVGLLSQVSQDLTWWIVEVSWSSLGVNALALISGLLLARRTGVVRGLAFW